MHLELIPLLRAQRKLYDVPRGWERFREYLALMTGDTGDMVLPLPAMNPMGKEHVSALYDTLLAIDADVVATQAVGKAGHRLEHVEGTFRVGLVVSDDAQGGWTNRYTGEFSHRFDGEALLKRGWIVPIFWTGDWVSPVQVRQVVSAAIFRTAYIRRHGWPKTLRQMLAQEGLAATFAGIAEPAFEQDELKYIRQVVEPYLDASDYPILCACLFGDEAAQSLGYRSLGLAPRAGFGLALAEARRRQEPPEASV
jgi:hypothetical protein